MSERKKSPKRSAKRNKVVPRFKGEKEEREFWDAHDSADYVDWSKATPVTSTPTRRGDATTTT